MNPSEAEDVILLVCMGVCLAGLLGLWLLRNSRTRFSRWLDSIDPGNDS